MDRLNLISDEARERLGQYVNDRYKEVTSAIGVDTSRRTVIEVAAGDDLPDVVIPGVEKVIRVMMAVTGQSPHVLHEHLYDEITNFREGNGTPSGFAVKRMGSQEVTITLNADPGDDFTLTVEGYELADELADDAEPAFPESFHDILVEGLMSIELRKMEKPDLAQLAEQRFSQRLSDLRMFIAKSAYKDIYQGKMRMRPFGRDLYSRWFPD